MGLSDTLGRGGGSPSAVQQETVGGGGLSASLGRAGNVSLETNPAIGQPTKDTKDFISDMFGSMFTTPIDRRMSSPDAMQQAVDHAKEMAGKSYSGLTYGDAEKKTGISFLDKALSDLGYKGTAPMSNDAKAALDAVNAEQKKLDSLMEQSGYATDEDTAKASRDAIDAQKKVLADAEQAYQKLKDEDKGRYYSNLMGQVNFDGIAKSGQNPTGTINKIEWAKTHPDNTYDVGQQTSSNFDNLKYATEDETNIYNYLLGMGDVAGADEFLEYIQPSLNARAGNEVAQSIASDTGASRFGRELAVAAGAGLEGAMTGIAQNFSDDALATPSSQFALQGVGQDISKRHDGKAFNLEKVAVDAVNTMSNMLPSMLAGAVNPALGAVATGASTKGRTYQDLLNQGYSKTQAGEVATILGVSEAATSYLIGGVSALGGKLTGVTAEKLTERITSASAKAVVKLGIEAIGEDTEEWLQNKIEAAVRNAILYEDNDIKFMDADDLYTIVLTTLTTALLQAPATIINTASDASLGKSVIENKATDSLISEALNAADDHIRELATRMSKNENLRTDTNLGELAKGLSAEGFNLANLGNAQSTDNTATATAVAEAPTAETAVLTQPTADNTANINSSLDKVNAEIAAWEERLNALPESQRENSPITAQLEILYDQKEQLESAAKPKTPVDILSEIGNKNSTAQPIPTNENKAPTGADILTDVISPENTQQTAQTGANPLKVDTQQNGQTAQPVDYTKPGDNGAERVRGMDENVMSDAAMEQAIRDEVASDPDYYKQRTNADTLDAAKEIYSHGLEAAQATLNEALGKAKAGSKLAPEMVPLARMIANQLTRDGNVTEARRIISDIGAELTAAGQLGQAARILRDADPVTRVDVIKKMIAHLNSDLSKGQKRTNVRRGNGDTSGNILVNEDLLNQYANATDPEVQNQIMDNITTEIANQIPATLKEKFTAIRYLNMLGNFKTQGRNIVGNSVMAAFTVAKRHIVQSAAEMAASLATGGKTERNTSLVYDPALYKEAKADFANIAEEAMGESKYTDVSRIANNEIQKKREVFDSNIPGLSWLMQKYNKLTGDAMDVGDRVFIKMHYADSMAGWMQAHGIKSMSEMTAEQLADARAFSIKEAQEATFRDQNAVSDFAKNFDKNWGKAKVITQGIMPFRGTPANVGVRAIEYSPVGVIETIYKGIQASKGKTDVADVINSLSKNATGSALAIAGYLMAAAGTARGGEDDDKLDAFQKLQGQSDYSVNVKGNWVSLSQLAPMSVPFFMGVKLEEMLSDTEQFTTDDIMKILGCVTDPMLDMSMLSGVNDALDNIANFNGNVDALPKFLTNAVIGYLTQGLTNSLAGQLEQASEENRQTTYTTNDSILGKDSQYTLGKTLAKTPGIDYNQQDYVDAWGRTQSNGDLKERVWNSLLNPTYSTKENSTEVDKELERLYSDNKNVDGFPNVLPQKGSRSLTYKDADGIEHGLTPDEYMQYSKDRGQMSLKLVSDFMDSSQYKSMSDLERADVINELYSFAANRALHTVKEANGVKDNSDYQTLISGVDKPGTSKDRTGIKEEHIPNYIVYKAQLSSARKGDTPDYKAQDALLGQYDKLPKDVQAGLLEHGIVTKQDMNEHRVGLSTETVAKFELAKDKAQEKLDANTDTSGVVSLYGLANADLSEKDVQAILDNYSTLKSGYLSKATATTAKIMRSFGYTLNDAADFFYTADYKDGETSGSLNGSKLAVAISQLQGLTPNEQEAMYQEFRKELDYDGNPYPWKTSYNRAYNSASSSMSRYGSSYGRTGDDNKIANIKRGTPGADLLVSATNAAQPQQQPTDFFNMFQTNAVRR